MLNSNVILVNNESLDYYSVQISGPSYPET